jgi:hypothetical protein
MLREDFLIRSAAVQVACELVAAGVPNGRRVIDDACQRADEPGEVLAYWTANHGRKIPRAIKMGLGDACRRLYNQGSALKYDTASKAFRFADVLELCHVHPLAEVTVEAEQVGEPDTVQIIDKSDLFKFLLDQRHHDDGYSRLPEGKLAKLWNHHGLAVLPESQRRQYLRDNGPESLADAGFTWERLSSWLPGGMDAEAWEAVIPSMGVMALIRNLRNFDQANISKSVVDKVIAKITDPAEVEKSRIFPYQVLLAYQFAQSDNWKRALGDTVDLASGNLPRLDGSVLCIDTSASMRAPLSAKSKADRVTVAGLQAASIARHSRDCRVVIFGQGNLDITDEVRGKSLLGAAQHVYDSVGRVGHSTYGHTAIRDHFDPDVHTRAVIFTDDQQHDSGHVKLDHVPQIITFNVGGYHARSTYGKGRIQVAGFSDAIFNTLAKLLNAEATEPVGTTV